MADTEIESEESMCLPVPGDTADEGLSFLESVAAGNVGAGVKMTGQGTTIPQIRTEYKQLILTFEQQLQDRMRSGMPSDEIARWAVNERTRIAQTMRAKQGLSSKVILDLRDNVKYGPGGRTYDNLEKRALKKGVDQADIPERLLKNAVKPNKVISDAAVEGAQFLKHGGKAVVVISISITAYTLLTAPEGQLERIIYQEIGGAAGGAIGGGAGVGLCIVFGVATSGWGLLACGVVGGGAGGYLGSKAGDKVYFLKGDLASGPVELKESGFQVIEPSDLHEDISSAEASNLEPSRCGVNMSCGYVPEKSTFARPTTGNRSQTQYPICRQ